MPVHLDANAAAADRILPVNRIKPHTCFKGPIESGCTKMAVVGFGKRPGASSSTRAVRSRCATVCSTACAAIKSTGRLLGGVGSIESTAGDVVSRRAASTADDVGGDLEHELTEYARALVPALPFDEIDVLIIERGGKDISGTTIDPNVTGRFWVQRARRPAERRVVSAIVLLDLTDVSDGNVLGIGFADFIPASLANKIDFREDLHQLLHRRAGRHASVADADGAARRGGVHQGGAVDVRPWRRRAEARRAHQVDAAPHPLLGQRRPPLTGRGAFREHLPPNGSAI